MIIGIPASDGHDATRAIVAQLEKVSSPDLNIVVVDNASDLPYIYAEFGSDSKVEKIRFTKNQGYYRPLKTLYDLYPEEEFIGIMHNDVMIYEENWDQRMVQAFRNDPKLGLALLFGSNEIDERGGRGGGSMCYFSGRQCVVGNKTYTGQSQAAGARISDVRASATSDSLFMMFRRDAIPHLCNEIDPWEDVTLAHFYDRIWPLRTIEAGYHVATIGIECDHIGGLTCTANERYRYDCIQWLEERNIPYDNPETEMYLVAERRYLGEYRDTKHFIPCKVGPNYEIQHLYRG